MQDFVFQLPTKIIFGRDTIGRIGPESAIHGRKVLLVYGRGSIKKNGIHGQVTKSLTRAGLKIVEHGDVQANPVVSHVRQGIALAKEHSVETVVAVGGGSVIDSAKAIAAGALVDHDVWLFFRGKKSIRQTLPVTTVPTLAGAGSEMNSGMVLTNEQTRQKFGTGNKLLYPKVSILDPTVTFSVPRNQTAYGAVDGIAHLLEFYFTTEAPCTPLQDRLMEGLAVTLMEGCDKALANPEDYRARADLMWCAALALSGLTAAGLGRVGFPMHMIEHSLSALHNVPHGAGLSVVMPGWMRFQAEKRPARFARFAKRLFGITAGKEPARAEQGIAALRLWFETIQSPTSLAALGILERDIPALAENALALAKIWRLTRYSREDIETILRLCLRS